MVNSTADEDVLEVPARPLPRQTHERNTPSSSTPATPAPDQQYFAQSSGRASLDGASTPSVPRSRSILNLTSSTLFGIYKDTGYSTDREEPTTPWGTGAETPIGGRNGSLDMLRSSIPEAFSKIVTKDASTSQIKSVKTTRRRPHPVRKGLKGYWLPMMITTAALYAVGVLYGLLISHLHDRDDVAPVKVEGIDRSGWTYPIFWGVTSVVLGWTLPAVDTFWTAHETEEAENKQKSSDGRGSGAWNDIIRSVGLFVGIAFAIRKLPWQSTSQLTLTLALANPAIWYIIDRSAPGFLVSTVVAIAGTAVLLLTNPALVPAPAAQSVPTHNAKHMGQNLTLPVSHIASEQLFFGFWSEESIGVATWLVSVLFVSSVCFGNIGRRLASQR